MRPAFVLAVPTMSASGSNLYATRCTDKPDQIALRAANLAGHVRWAVDNLQSLNVAGAIRTTAHGSPIGSFLIMRENNLQTVRNMLSNDPYAKVGLFDTVETRHWVCGMKCETTLPDNLFSVWCVDKTGLKDLRKETRPHHLDWWKQSGRIGWIGPFPAEDGDGAVGSLIVCGGESLEDVQQWAATDPYNEAGLFETVHVNYLEKSIEDGKMLMDLPLNV